MGSAHCHNKGHSYENYWPVLAIISLIGKVQTVLQTCHSSPREAEAEGLTHARGQSTFYIQPQTSWDHIVRPCVKRPKQIHRKQLSFSG